RSHRLLPADHDNRWTADSFLHLPRSEPTRFPSICVVTLKVTRSPSPDSPANAIGGSVNLVSRSAFERSKPTYMVKTYLSWRGGDFKWEKTPGPFQHKEYPFEPNVELNAVVP